jgi:hypothetical protein
MRTGRRCRCLVLIPVALIFVPSTNGAHLLLLRPFLFSNDGAMAKAEDALQRQAVVKWTALCQK